MWSYVELNSVSFWNSSSHSGIKHCFVELCGIMWNKFISQFLRAFNLKRFVAAACRRPSLILAERSLAASSTLIRLDSPLQSATAAC